MSHSTVPEHPDPQDQIDLGLHDPLADSFPHNPQGRLLFWIAVAFSLFQIATAAHLVDFASQVVRAVHVAFLLLLTFPLLALARRRSPATIALAWMLAGVGVAVAAYQSWEYTELLLRAGTPIDRRILQGVLGAHTVPEEMLA